MNFTLLADPEGKVIALYGVQSFISKIAKRWTFLLDPNLKIQWIEKDVDPVLDAQKVADQLKTLQAKK